jgi:N-acetylglutamate synthase-like GNAT family acetyltransferase
MTQAVTIRTITVSDREAYEQVYALREEVLRKPIGLSLKNEDLSADKMDTIVIAEQGNEVIGCLMIHPTDDTKVMKLRQMAVSDKEQGRGIGKQLMLAAEQVIWNKGCERIVLHARVTAREFYDKLNYKTTSAVFTEVGIPHVVMEKAKEKADEV